MADVLKYETPLSLTGIRDLHLDLTLPLSYKSETLASVTVTSSDTSLVTISSAQVNTGQLTNDDGTTAEIGKAAQWRATAVKASTSRVYIDVEWTGTGGTADTHRIELDLEPYVIE